MSTAITPSLRILGLAVVLLIQYGPALAKDRESEWLVGPDQLGRLKLGVTLKYPAALAAYPKATVTIEKGHPGERRAIGSDYYFVFRERDAELFRSECFCEPDPDGGWRFGRNVPHSLIVAREDVWMHPVTSNTHFVTERGVSVGSTVGELRAAYPEAGRLLYFSSGATPNAGPDMEWVCFLSAKESNRAKPGTVESIRFYVKPPPGVVQAGGEQFGSYLSGSDHVNERAIVIAIEPHQLCGESH